jgi:hypothetical protein
VTDQKSNGWAVMGNTGNPAAAYFEFAEPLGEDMTVTVQLTQNYGTNHTLGKFRLSATTAPRPIRAPNAAAPAEVLAAIKVGPAQRSAEQTALLLKHFRSIAPPLRETREQLAARQKERADFEKSLPHCLVSEHTDQSGRCGFAAWGPVERDRRDSATRSAPFSPQPKRSRLTRLDLGRWLVARRIRSLRGFRESSVEAVL